jgi:uncharacterized protein (DUF2164 family)
MPPKTFLGELGRSELRSPGEYAPRPDVVTPLRGRDSAVIPQTPLWHHGTHRWVLSLVVRSAAAECPIHQAVESQAVERVAESSGPMRIRLSDERRKRIERLLQALFTSELDREISEFQAGVVLDFFIRELGAPVYNQAIQDARGFVQEKLSDLEGEFYEPSS